MRFDRRADLSNFNCLRLGKDRITRVEGRIDSQSVVPSDQKLDCILEGVSGVIP